VDLDEFIGEAFCTIDDALRKLPASRLRTRGPAPVLADSEVLTLEVVGEFLGLDQDVPAGECLRGSVVAGISELRIRASGERLASASTF
jgi:hypothetical protein